MRIDHHSKTLPQLHQREPAPGTKRARLAQSTQTRSTSVDNYQTRIGAAIEEFRESEIAAAKAKIDSGEYFTKDAALQVANAILES